jgi:hypothetical protein
MAPAFGGDPIRNGEMPRRRASDQSAQTAEDCFNEAGEVARERGAPFWETPIALCLARLRVSQGRDDVANQILAPVYGSFTDGYETTDLRAAKALPGSLTN